MQGVLEVQEQNQVVLQGHVDAVTAQLQQSQKEADADAAGLGAPSDEALAVIQKLEELVTQVASTRPPKGSTAAANCYRCARGVAQEPLVAGRSLVLQTPDAAAFVF